MLKAIRVQLAHKEKLVLQVVLVLREAPARRVLLDQMDRTRRDPRVRLVLRVVRVFNCPMERKEQLVRREMSVTREILQDQVPRELPVTVDPKVGLEQRETMDQREFLDRKEILAA